MRSSIRSLLILLVVSAPLINAVAEEPAEEGILDSLRVSMPNGTLPTFPGDKIERVKQMVVTMRENPSLSIGVIATYSKVRWSKRYGKKAGEALQGAIALTRTGITDRILVKEAKMTRAEIATRYNFAVLLDETGTDDEPYVDILLAEKTWIDALAKQLEKKLKAWIESLKEELKQEVKEEIREELKGWIEALVKELFTQNSGSGRAFFLLPVENGRVSEMKDKDRQLLWSLLKTANDPETDLRVVIASENRKAAGAVKDLLAHMGLRKKPAVFYFGLGRARTGPKRTQVAVTLATGLGDWTSWDASEEPSEDTSAMRPLSLILGAGVHWESGWNAHRTQGTGSTTVFPTVNAGLGWDRVAVVCKAQLPESLFENTGGDPRLSEIQLLVRIFGPVCASLSWERYVSRHVERKPSDPNTDLVFGEKTSGLGFGVHGDFSEAGLRGLGAGAGIVFVDREHQLPPHWTIEKKGDIQVRAYVSYGLSFFPF